MTPTLGSERQLFALARSEPEPLAVSGGGETVHEILADFPLAVYSGMRTFHHDRFFRLEAHLDRLDRNLGRLRWAVDLDRDRFRRALHTVVTAYPLPDARVRCDVASEPISSRAGPAHVLIALSPLEAVPERFVREGVRVEIAEGLRRARPRIKTTDFVAARRPFASLGQECFEHLLVDGRGRLLEGTSSNFFGLRDGVLHTAGTGVLEGVTRSALLSLAAGLGLPVALEPVHRDSIAELDEAFLSSSTRSLVPIVNVAGAAVGDGTPGPVTRRLLAGYRELVEREARPAVAATSP